MRAHTSPRPHHPHRPHPPWPAFPRHYTDLARIFLVFREYSKAANACPHPPAPSPPTPHHPGLATTHTWLHFLSVWRVLKGCQCVPTPPRTLTTPPLACVSSPLHRPGSHFVGVFRVFKGCQCVPTPPRALTTPTTHTWLAFPRCLGKYKKAANACPHLPAPSPPPPPTPHSTPASPLLTPGLHFLGV